MSVEPLIDGHGRLIEDLRISVTDRCNFRCQYCMPAEGLPWLQRDALLTYEELARVVRVLSEMGVRVPLQQEAVGGQREVAQAVDPRQHRGELREVAAHERLAAGEADVGDAHRGEQRHQALDLLEREDLRALEPREPLGRHAVLAAEVAAVGHREAQVADGPAVSVHQLVAPHRV